MYVREEVCQMLPVNMAGNDEKKLKNIQRKEYKTRSNNRIESIPSWMNPFSSVRSSVAMNFPNPWSRTDLRKEKCDPGTQKY